MRLRRGLLVEQQLLLGLHGWHVVGRGRDVMRCLHDVRGRHIQERLVLVDRGHYVHKLRGGLLLEHDQRGIVHGVPDGHGLPGLDDDGPEHVRLRRGLRVERQRVRGLHGWHVVRRRLYFVLGLYLVHGGQLRVDRVLDDGQCSLLGMHGWDKLVLGRRDVVHGLHDVRGRHFQERLVHRDRGHDDVHELRRWHLLEHDERGVVHALPDGHGLPGLHDDGQEHVRLRRGLHVELCEQHVRGLHGRHLVRRRLYFVHTLHNLRCRNVQERHVLLDRRHDDVRKLCGRTVLELFQCCVVHGVPDGDGLPGLHDNGPEHVRLRRGLRVELSEQHVCGLHGRQHLVGRGCNCVHRLHDVPGGHIQERRKLHDDERPHMHQLHGGKVLGRARRHFVHCLSNGDGLPGLHDDAPEHVRLRRGLRVELCEQHVCGMHGRQHLVVRRRFLVHIVHNLRGRNIQERHVLLDRRHDDVH